MFCRTLWPGEDPDILYLSRGSLGAFDLESMELSPIPHVHATLGLDPKSFVGRERPGAVKPDLIFLKALSGRVCQPFICDHLQTGKSQTVYTEGSGVLLSQLLHYSLCLRWHRME